MLVQTTTFTVVLDPTLIGTIKVEPVLPTDGQYPAGCQYVQVGGAGHAFFDWKPDERTKATFMKYGVYYAAEMKAFFNSVIYKMD